MNIGETLYVRYREEWRRWLADHHRDKKEVWLIFFKKSSGKSSISYDDAVEETICYGWIDSQQKPIDKEKFARRFTPRRKQSGWSKHNKAHVLKMLRDGKITQAGKALLPMDVLNLLSRLKKKAK